MRSLPGSDTASDLDSATHAGLAGSEAGPQVHARTRKSPMRRQEARVGLGLITPTVVIVIVVVVVPIVWSIALAFQRVRLLTLRSSGLTGEFTLGNFQRVASEPGFASSLLTTLAYSVLGTAGAISVGLLAALVLRRSFRSRGLARSVMLVPYIAPVVAVTYVWETMLSPQFGILNHWGQRLLGWDQPIAFLTQRSHQVDILGLTVTVPLALLTVIAFEIWRSFPFAFLFLMARLQAAPAELEEAARVDGATPSQRFRYVLLPQLMPTIAMLSVLRFIWTFNSFDEIYLLTGGGAGTEVISVRVFNFLTARGDIGLAAAQALVLAIILVLLVGIYIRRFGAREEDA